MRIRFLPSSRRRWRRRPSLGTRLGLSAPRPAARTATLIAVGDIASCARGRRRGDGAARGSRSRARSRCSATPSTRTARPRSSATATCPPGAAFWRRTRAALGNHEYANGGSDAAAAKATFRLRGKAGTRTRSGRGTRSCSTRTATSSRAGSGHRSGAGSGPISPGTGKPGARSPTGTTRASARAAHGSDVRLAPFWDLLAAARADLVLTGHDHHYERFGAAQGDSLVRRRHRRQEPLRRS